MGLNLSAVSNLTYQSDFKRTRYGFPDYKKLKAEQQEHPYYTLFAAPNFDQALFGMKSGLYKASWKSRRKSTGNIPYESWTEFCDIISMMNFHMSLENLTQQWQDDKFVCTGIATILFMPHESSGYCIGTKVCEEIYGDLVARKSLIIDSNWLSDYLEDEDRKTLRWTIPEVKQLYKELIAIFNVASNRGMVCWE